MSYCRKDSLKESLLTVNNLNFSEQTSICYEKIQNHSSCTNYQNNIISDFMKQGLTVNAYIQTCNRFKDIHKNIKYCNKKNVHEIDTAE